MSDIVQGVGGLVGGLVSGIQGPIKNNFQAAAAPIVNPVSSQQLQTGYDQTQNALMGQQTLAQQLAGQGGLQNQQNTFQQQQTLASALQNQANGVGPNPAQAQLAQATGANVANQAALMAGQRGASSNAGLIARQAGQQGAGIQQNAVGQSATLQAQQQIAAQQQLAAQQQAMQQVAGNQINNQIGSQNALTGASLQNQSTLLGAQGGYNNALVGSVSGQNAANSQTAAGNSAQAGQIFGGLLGGAGAALGAYDGGVIDSHHQEMAKIYHPGFSQGGQVPVMVSPGEVYVPPENVGKVATGKENIMDAGKKVPGKAQVKGDNPKNDTVPATLEEGGIVIPKSVMESDDPLKEGKKFLADALKKHGKKGFEENDFKSALKNAIASRGA